jgi:hypothetical protein
MGQQKKGGFHDFIHKNCGFHLTHPAAQVEVPTENRQHGTCHLSASWEDVVFLNKWGIPKMDGL